MDGSHLEQEVPERDQVAHTGPQQNGMVPSLSGNDHHDVVLPAVARQNELVGGHREVEQRDVELGGQHPQACGHVLGDDEALRPGPRGHATRPGLVNGQVESGHAVQLLRPVPELFG